MTDGAVAAALGRPPASRSAGFTGLGVGPSRFAADVLLDLLGGTDTERTRVRP